MAHIVPAEKGKVYKVKIIEIVGNNEGVGHVERFPVYVKGVSRNDKGKEVKVKVSSIKKYYCEGIKEP